MPIATTEHLETAQLYVRWPAERARFAIEFRLDLVPQLSLELARGSQQGIEVGGVMLGRILPGRTPTLRIEAIEMIRRRREDGPTFLLNPDQLNLFREICLAAKSSGRAAIGLFRSQLRSDVLRPSAADRSLVCSQFGQDPHALLLVHARVPHSAAFFASYGSEWAAEPAMPEFLLDEAALKTLPEAPAEEPAAITRPMTAKAAHNRSLWVLGAFSLLLAALFIWLVAREPLLAALDRSPNQINLSAAPSGSLLRISWSHSARQISRATGATMTILDGPRRVQLSLDPDELRFGCIVYQRRNTSNAVRVSMKVDTPDRAIPLQSVLSPRY